MTSTASWSPRTAVAIPKDPRLPQLGMALDPGRMRPLLPFPDSVEGRDVKVAYVRYKPGTNCIVLYEVEQENGSPLWAYAKLFADESNLKLADGSRIASYHPEHRMVLLRFPQDLEIPSLGMAMNPDLSDQLLTRVAGRRKMHWFTDHWGLWTPVRYKPERRCVIRGLYQDPKGRGIRGFYARFYGAHEGVKTPLWHRHFKRLKDARVCVPRLLASSHRRRALFVAEHDGEPLRAFFSKPESDVEQAIRTVADALASWHRLAPPAGAPPLESHVDQIKAAARAVDLLLEDPQNHAAELVNRLAAAAPRASSPALLHGDFYYDQVLLAGDKACFLDLDELGVGDPVQDVANFCAYTVLLELDGKITSSRSGAMCEWFVDAYQSAVGKRIRPEKLAWHLSA